MVATVPMNAGMAKKQKAAAKSPGAGRHKPGKMVRVPMEMVVPLERLAAKRMHKLTNEVKLAISQYLEREGESPEPAAGRRK